MLTDDLFKIQFKILADHYNYDVSKNAAIAKIYYRYLSQHLSDTEFMQTVEMVIINIPPRMSLPSPDEILEMFKGSRKSQGLLDWQTIIKAASANNREMLAYLPNRAHVALSAVGGLGAVSMTEEGNLKWLQKDFLEVYCQSTAVDKTMLPAASSPVSNSREDDTPMTLEQWQFLQQQIQEVAQRKKIKI